tara:strand:+ start:409 stop:1146 length:738 start_codon:yes stop_codon:yes gene_type:complete
LSSKIAQAANSAFLPAQWIASVWSVFRLQRYPNPQKWRLPVAAVLIAASVSTSAHVIWRPTNCLSLPTPKLGQPQPIWDSKSAWNAASAIGCARAKLISPRYLPKLNGSKAGCNKTTITSSPSNSATQNIKIALHSALKQRKNDALNGCSDAGLGPVAPKILNSIAVGPVAPKILNNIIVGLVAPRKLNNNTLDPLAPQLLETSMDARCEKANPQPHVRHYVYGFSRDDTGAGRSNLLLGFWCPA